MQVSIMYSENNDIDPLFSFFSGAEETFVIQQHGVQL